MFIKNMPMPNCMIPDGAPPCNTYQQLYDKGLELEKVVQMCFDDACKPSGKVSKKTVIELMKHANTAA